MKSSIENAIEVAKKHWNRVLPDEPMPADDQWAIWCSMHLLKAIMPAITQTAVKRKKVGAEMTGDRLIRFASAVMTRLSREANQYHRKENNGMNNNDNVNTNINLDRPRNEAEAKLAAAEHYKSDVKKGEALLQRLPVDPTHGDLKHLIQQDHDTLLASVEQHPSLNKGVHEAQ